ncbi:MAG: hypothetical protein Q8K59_03215, partial [Nitrosomonas sp.]|nr:hypothetical protein [Nitrosomonas sp.]
MSNAVLRRNTQTAQTAQTAQTVSGLAIQHTFHSSAVICINARRDPVVLRAYRMGKSLGIGRDGANEISYIVIICCSFGNYLIQKKLLLIIKSPKT